MSEAIHRPTRSQIRPESWLILENQRTLLHAMALMIRRLIGDEELADKIKRSVEATERFLGDEPPDQS